MIACLLVIYLLWPACSFAISIPEEKELAKKFMASINNQQVILRDPVAQHFINQIGEHLLAPILPQPFDYNFYIVDDDIFNAFAAPGANIFVYRGLITSLDSIDELAGIIAHEIAHASSRHVSESIDRSKYITLGSLAGMLAGAIIGTSSDATAGHTLMKGSLALGQTTMLAFTRENETEADEKGVMFLKNSCFSPWGLLSGLDKIREADFRGLEGIPDYVKTHPGTSQRIAHTETILSNYQLPLEKQECRFDFEFDMIKYRLLGLYATPDEAYQQIRAQLTEKTGNAALHYGMGLVYARKQRQQQAISHLQKALNLKMFDPMILVDLGRIYLQNDEPQKALNVLHGLESEPAVGLLARLYQADACLDTGDTIKAEKGYQTVIKKAAKTFPQAYFNLAKIKSMNKEKGLSHYYLGIHYTMIGNEKNAIYHLEKSIPKMTDQGKITDAKNRLEQINKSKQPKSN